MSYAKGLVSISIPFLNSEDFLSEAIESVLAQTYTNWEIFLVDDGSSDRSTQIARAYSVKFSGKIAYLEHPCHRNMGPAASRNLGARHGRGEYLAFLDSDDVWLPKKLQDQVALLDGHREAGLVYGLSEYWYDWDKSKSVPQQNHVPILAPGKRLYDPPSLLVSTYPFGSFGAPCPSSFLVRRSAFDRVGGFEECFNPKTYQLYEDTAFLTKMYLTAQVYVGDTCWDKYRCHSRSMSQFYQDTNREELARRVYFHWLRGYIRHRRIEGPKVLGRILRKAWQYWLPLPTAVTRFIRRAENRLSRLGL